MSVKFQGPDGDVVICSGKHRRRKVGGNLGDGVKSLWHIQVENYRQLEIWILILKRKAGLEIQIWGSALRQLQKVKAMRLNDIICKKEMKVLLENILIPVC